ncbi:MAG: DUF4174 domain-containing protein [Pseudomonadota bacterium]
MWKFCAAVLIALWPGFAGAEDSFERAAQAPSLDEAADILQWSYRLLVVDDRVLSDQLESLDPDDLIERDLIIVAFGHEGITLARFAPEGDTLDAIALDDPSLPSGYSRALADKNHRVLLIGKDGDFKKTWPGPVGQAELNAIIDAMPMRAREMRRGG